MSEEENRGQRRQNPRPGLRCGQFTLGMATPKKARAPRATAGTSRDEEAMLFGEPADDSISQ